MSRGPIITDHFISVCGLPRASSRAIIARPPPSDNKGWGNYRIIRFLRIFAARLLGPLISRRSFRWRWGPHIITQLILNLKACMQGFKAWYVWLGSTRLGGANEWRFLMMCDTVVYPRFNSAPFFLCRFPMEMGMSHVSTILLSKTLPY